MTHFCTCQNTACRCHPSNHSQGCDLCIQKELRKGEIPQLLFQSGDPTRGDSGGLYHGGLRPTGAGAGGGDGRL